MKNDDRHENPLTAAVLANGRRLMKFVPRMTGPRKKLMGGVFVVRFNLKFNFNFNGFI